VSHDLPILVDNRTHSTLINPSYVVTRHTLRALANDCEPDLPSRLAPLENKIFADYARFSKVLRKVLGTTRFERHQQRILHLALSCFSGEVRAAIPWHDERDRRLGGPGYGWLADVMDQHGLRVPLTRNTRLRYHFTEGGWRNVGRHVAAEARRLGHVVRVIRQKNPEASQVLYRDEYQVAILQHRLRD
jgi:hypothetical protein